MPYTAAVAPQQQVGDWPKEAIAALRERLDESVAEFGARFGRSGRTVEDWEQGRRNPDILVKREMDRIANRLK